MKYNSIADYFIRLQSRSLLCLFLALASFMALFYFLKLQDLTTVMLVPYPFITSYSLIIIAFMTLLFSRLIARASLRSVKGVVSLGERLDKFARAQQGSLLFFLFGAGLLLLAFYIHGGFWLIIVYSIYLLLYLLTWPTRKRVCKVLQLKTAERNVIFGK